MESRFGFARVPARLFSARLGWPAPTRARMFNVVVVDRWVDGDAVRVVTVGSEKTGRRGFQYSGHWDDEFNTAILLDDGYNH
ncbi:hypothetical protein VNO78_33224 [Psophocarpus tetragonolobus]|uniref:Uncharacterized protein n=1 Tax=Psophocarpus tetragonolobus TaxID=3891 RepID=A0AAN9P1Z8_PSOTE